MNETIAAASPEIWNQKNQPSDIERFDQSPGHTQQIIEQLPAAAIGFARRRPAVLILAALGILGAVWYFSTRE